MKLLEQRGVRRQMRLEQAAGLLVSGLPRQQAVSRQDAADVRVRHEHRTAHRVEQDRVDRLGPESGNGEQLATQRRQRRSPQPAEPAVEPLQQPSRERLKPPRLDAVEPGGADGLPELGPTDGGQAFGTEEPARAQRRHRARRARPGRMLCEHGTDGDLVGGPSRPPALRPEASLERDVGTQQPCLHRIRRRPGNVPPAKTARWLLQGYRGAPRLCRGVTSIREAWGAPGAPQVN